ncbi:predicted protein [Nematostella vectensis]|uniref:Homeobox domain-containing protein n=2 Tax=Nematostella vectensis TaxID=45351 RepID=A7RHQ5_NEMVE|nr:homeobox protein NANOG [Nematostella vectensis]EDO49019.1 predicted protein [Nematostella vectensis]|eukprot:XP_001641082.1 predicted protein [Nematostella vectensis]
MGDRSQYFSIENLLGLKQPIKSFPTEKNGEGSQRKRRTYRRKLFTDTQLESLNTAFARQKYLSSKEQGELATTLGLTSKQIKTWFQNKRYKSRQKEMKNLFWLGGGCLGALYQDKSTLPPLTLGFQHHYNYCSKDVQEMLQPLCKWRGAWTSQERAPWPRGEVTCPSQVNLTRQSQGQVTWPSKGVTACHRQRSLAQQSQGQVTWPRNRDFTSRQ